MNTREGWIEKICPRLINAEKHRKLLESLPHERFFDLALIYHIRDLQLEKGGNAYVLSYEMAERWELPREKLFDIAMENAVKKQPVFREKMWRMIKELSKKLGQEDCFIEGRDLSEGMYVLSNQDRWWGAVGILYPGIASGLAKELDNSYFVLPSSIHECIVVVDEGQYSPKDLQTMVRDVNESMLAAEEILSDHVYYYDKKEERFYMDTRSGE